MTKRTICKSMVAICVLFSTVAGKQNRQADPWRARMHDARIQYVAGNYAEAERLYLSALEGAGGATAANSRAAATYLQLGALYNAQKRYAKAEQAFTRRLAICEELYGADDIQVLDAVISLANSSETAGHRNEAETMYRRAVSIRERYYGANHEQVAYALNSLARCLDGSQKWSEAEETAKRAVSILTARYSAGDSRLTTSYLILGSIYSRQNRFAEAEQAYLHCLSVMADSADANTEASYRNALAGLYAKSGKFREAERVYKTNIERLEGMYGVRGVELIPTLEGYADLLRLMGRQREATVVATRIEALKKK